MKISILLPTRNGAALLPDCVASVLEQEAEDFELVVSDNASDDGTAEVLARWSGDPRLRVRRQAAPLSVTENWTQTLALASGEYVLLLGDDDCLLAGAIERLQQQLRGQPDVVSFQAYGFAFPGSLDAVAHYSEPLFAPDPTMPSSGELPLAWRLWAVRELFRFEFRLCLNLQTTLVSRRALERLPGQPFVAPYPDFYAINALLIRAERWLHIPDLLTCVGISPKSFGRTLRTGGTESGRAYLGIDTRFPGYLPGTDMLNGTHMVLERLARDFPEQGLEISRRNYVYRQMYDWYLSARLHNIDGRELRRRLALLSLADWAGFAREMASRFSPAMVRRHASVGQDTAVAAVWPGMRSAPDQVSTIGEFAAWAAERERTNASARRPSA